MKNLLAVFLLAATALNVFGQGATIRSLNGLGTNTTLRDLTIEGGATNNGPMGVAFTLHVGKTSNPQQPGRVEWWSEEAGAYLAIYAEDNGLILDAPATTLTVPALSADNQVNSPVVISTGNGVSTTIRSNWISTGRVNTGDFTNTSVTSAFPYGDANGKQGEATTANFISTVTGTPNGSRVLRDDWSWADATAGTDTNAISYLTTLIKAAGVRTLASGTPVFEITYTNGFQAIGVTNNGSDTDSFAIRDSTGLNVFNFVTGSDTFLRSAAHFYGFVNTSIPFIEAGLNTRRLFDTNGNIIIEFADDTTGVNITTLNPTTVNTAAINLGENSGAIALDAALSADGKSSGITRAGTAGATLAFGDLVVLDVTDSRWELADANSASGADGDARGMIGVCVLAAAADGDPTVILLQGVVRADAAFPSFTVNAPVYVSETAGDITATSPTTSGNVVRILGAATTADEIYFDPDRVWTIYVP